MSWITAENKQRININEIPIEDITTLRKEIVETQRRVVGFFGKKEVEGTRLFVVTANDKEGKFYISSSMFT